MSGIPLLGELLSVVAALSWAVGVVLFKRSGESIPPTALNLFKNAIAVAFLVPTLVLAGTPFVPHVPASDWVFLILSGVLGISLADTLFFMSLGRLGAGLVAVVDTVYAPGVIVLSSVFLHENMGFQALAGAALITCAILVGAAGRPEPGRTRRDIVTGTILGAASVLLMAVGIVIVKEVLGRVSVLWATTVRVSAGAAGLLPLLLVPACRREMTAVFRPSRTWRFAVPASVLGTYVAMLAWIGGMKLTLASVAAVLNQLSTIFIFVLAAIFLRERVTPRRVAATVLAVAGALLVALR